MIDKVYWIDKYKFVSKLKKGDVLFIVWFQLGDRKALKIYGSGHKRLKPL
jgi:hypothetical protein